MNDEARQVAVRWRRILFGFHLCVWLIARLAVGSINEMPPFAIYDGLSLWGLIVLAHGGLLAFVDGRDRADPPFRWMTALVQPRERRWSLFVIDVTLWLLFTIAIASRVIPEGTIFRYVVPLSLAWLAHTGFGMLHILLMIYAEVRERSLDKTKPKRDTVASELPRLAPDDGELIDFPEPLSQRKGRE